MYKKKGVKAELIKAYMCYSDCAYTHHIPTTLTRISRKGKVLFYIEPYGADYECDGGHHCQILSEEDFRLEYSEHPKSI